MKAPRELLSSAADRMVAANRSVVVAHLRRLRRTRPDATPAQLLRAVERYYLATVTSAGALAGGAAAAPGVGTAAGVVINVAEIPAFIEATALLALTYAEVHGVRLEDLERRRTLVYAVLLGNGGTSTVQKMAGTTGAHWGKHLVKAIDMKTINAINKVLGRWFVTKYGTKEGILVLGRELPFGFGAGIGAAGNAGFGYLNIRAARRVFGPPPDQFSNAASDWTGPQGDPGEVIKARDVVTEPTDDHD